MNATINTTVQDVRVNLQPLIQDVRVNVSTVVYDVNATVVIGTGPCADATVLVNGDNSFPTIPSGGLENIGVENTNGAPVGSYDSNTNSWVVGDSVVTLRDSANNVLSVTNIAATDNDDIPAPDATYNLDNSEGSTLFLGSIPSGDNETIIAPDGAVNNSDTTYTALVASGGVLALPDQTIEVNTVNEGSIPSVGTIEIDITDGVNPVTPDSVDITGRKVTIEVPTMDVDFSADKLVAAPFETITFTDLTNNSPTEWAWDFNGEGYRRLQNPTFSFSTLGFKNITLFAAKTGLGGFNTKTNYIEIVSNLLLDLYPSASAAYSLRLLRLAYTGSAIRVRRSNDNAEQDIGFVNGVLDSTALLSFVGANNGFVVTWYDQSGNGFNATQGTQANQPQIVSSGSIILVNGKPSIDITSGGVRLDLPNASYLYNQTQFFGISVSFTDGAGGAAPTIYAAYTSSNNYKAALGYNNVISQRYYVGGRRTGADSFIAAADANNYLNAQVLQIGHLNYATGVASIYTNNNAVVNNNSFHVGQMDNTTSATPDNIGGNSATQFFNGKIQEVIIYASDESSNVTGIKTNINTYYNVF